MSLYDANFHNAIAGDEWPFALRLGQHLPNMFQFSNVIDFGCSTGLYIKAIEIHHPTIPVIGFESSTAGVDLACTPSVHHGDLTDPHLLDDIPMHNALGICLEVLEHIPDEQYRACLFNLTKCPTLILSAARPGQGGTGHINLQTQMNWLQRFTKEYDMVLDVDATVKLIQWASSGYCLYWFLNNVMVFRQKDMPHE